MRNRTRKFFLTTLLSLALMSMGLEARKMTSHIIHGKPWIETRLTYSITASELAQKYYGNEAEVSELIKANKAIKSAMDILTKDMIIHIPVTNNFKEQPERLGWTSSKASDF
jgi:hypothetical protein